MRRSNPAGRRDALEELVVAQLMGDGRRTLARRILDEALERACALLGARHERHSPLCDVLDEVEAVSGRAHPCVPGRERAAQRRSRAVRFLVGSARERRGAPMALRLARVLVEWSSAGDPPAPPPPPSLAQARLRLGWTHGPWGAAVRGG